MSSTTLGLRLPVRVQAQDANRLLFFACTLWGAAMFWLAPRLAGTDIPQHAAQIALIRELWDGTSPWRDVLRLNLWTPYLVPYGVATLLSTVVPIVDALKLMLSLAFLANVALCVSIRRQWGGDGRLDWLFLLGFFAQAYKWGFFSFLVAVPVGLLLILAADRYAARQTTSRALALTAVGVLLFVSHGLCFLLVLTICMGLLAARTRRWSTLVAASWPYALMLAVCAGYLFVSKHYEGGSASLDDTPTELGWGLMRIPKSLVASIATEQRPLLLALALALPLVPWAMGCRPQRMLARWIPLIVTLAFMLFTPSFTMRIAMYPMRFGVLLLPAYAWAFSPSKTGAEKQRKPPRERAASAALVLMCLSLLSFHTIQAFRFGRESAEFEPVLRAMQPGQRALSLVLSAKSNADGFANAYLHHPHWYTADKHGLVDPSFAWFPNVVVRFRPQAVPAVKMGFEHHTGEFDWYRHHAQMYRYFVVRSPAAPQDLFAGSPCPPALVLQSGSWWLYENQGCR
jgi:hypothetical protein